MPRLDVISAPLHRCIYPGELSVEFTMYKVPEQDTSWYPVGIIINILYQNRQEQALDELARTMDGLKHLPSSATGENRVYRLHRGLYYPIDAIAEEPFAEIERDVLTLAHDDGEPYFVYIDGPDDMPHNPLDTTYVALCIGDLAGLIGEGLAYELGHRMIEAIEGTPAGTTIKPLFLRFRRMEAYNELYLNLCELIAAESGEAFDRQAKLRDILGFWTNSDGDSVVPDQLSLYEGSGPSKPGETQTDYDAEQADFQRLAHEGCLAAEVSLIFA